MSISFFGERLPYQIEGFMHSPSERTCGERKDAGGLLIGKVFPIDQQEGVEIFLRQGR
jgi:hypothetical protein